MKNLQKKKVVLIELNEFNYALIEKLSLQHNLKNFQKILSYTKSVTYTQDTYDSDYLEPWVQWVSVHTGKPSTKHKIKHLGDVPELDNQQIWEKLSDQGISSGIWGAMNASRGTAEHCKFFLPDPWTFSEPAYPEELKPLLDPLRYLSKNYLKISYKKLLPMLSRLGVFFQSNKALAPFLIELPSFIKSSFKFRGEAFSSISLFDYLSTFLFIQMNKKYAPDFSLIFLNSLAHLQHHHWNEKNIENSLRFKYGLKYLDRSLGLLLENFESTHTILIANALSQQNTNQDDPWILYRQKDHSKFLKAACIRFLKVEPHMTHDAHIFFNNIEDKEAAVKKLESMKIDQHTLFHVETYDSEPLKIFYKIIYTGEVEKTAQISCENKPFPFSRFFKSVIKRTGKHIQNATLLSNQKDLPPSIQNHEIFDVIEQCYAVDP